MSETKTAKAEAMEGVAHLRKMLADPAPLTGHRLVIFNSTLAWVEERVGAIVEVQRVRKPRRDADPDPEAEPS
jgi:hypothetical protein